MAKKKAKAKKEKGAREPVVVASKVKAYVRSKGKMSSKEFLGALNAVVCDAIDKAVWRAGENKRSTLQPRDL